MIDENLIKDFESTIEEPIVKEEDSKVEEKALAFSSDEPKSITDISMSDIKVHVDTSKSFEDQAKDFANMTAVVNAVNDEETTKDLKEQKKKELLNDSISKVKKSESNVINQKTAIQKAELENFSGILNTFGFYRQMPSWMTKAIVYMLTPFLFLIGFIIGIPCGAVKILMENVEGIVIKYEDTRNESKPKIRVTIIIVLVLLVVAAICLTTLGCLHII